MILYVLYHLYKLYKKGKIATFAKYFCKYRVVIEIYMFASYSFVEVLKRRRIPKCLLVYSPTRLSHINVMIELAKYLRICDVNAMIDMLDVTDTTDKVSASNETISNGSTFSHGNVNLLVCYVRNVGSRMLVRCCVSKRRRRSYRNFSAA